MCGEDKFDFLRVQSAALPTELPGHIELHDKNREEAELKQT